MESRVCVVCGSKIRNFTATTDWERRKLHKSCWKLKQDEVRNKILMEDFAKEQAEREQKKTIISTWIVPNTT